MGAFSIKCSVFSWVVNSVFSIAIYYVRAFSEQMIFGYLNTANCKLYTVYCQLLTAGLYLKTVKIPGNVTFGED